MSDLKQSTPGYTFEAPIRRLLELTPPQYRAHLLDVHRCILTPPELEGHLAVLEHLQQILGSIGLWIPDDLVQYEIGGWLDAIGSVQFNADWVAKVFTYPISETELLARDAALRSQDANGERANAMKKLNAARHAVYIQRFLFQSKARPNPSLRRTMLTHSLHAALWTSHPEEPLGHRILQAHILLAHIAITRVHVPIEDWATGSKPDGRLRKHLYLVGLRIRRFSEKHGPLETALRKWALKKLPRKCSIAKFPAKLRTISERIAKLEYRLRRQLRDEFWLKKKEKAKSEISPYKVSRELRGIASFIDWGLAPNKELSTVDQSGIERIGVSGGPPVSGRGDDEVSVLPAAIFEEAEEAPVAAELPDTGPEADSDEIWHADETERGEPVTVVSVARHNRLSAAEREAVGEAGDHPEDTGTEQEIVLAEDERGVRLIFSGTPEMACQNLSDNYLDQSPLEVARWMRALDTDENLKLNERLALRAFASTCLWTSAGENAACTLKVFEEQIPADTHVFAVCFVGSRAFWRIPALAPEVETQPTPGTAHTVVNSFDLPDVVGGTQPLREYFLFLRDVVKLQAAQPYSMQFKPLPLFRHELSWYKDVLNSIKVPGRAISWAKLSRLIRQEIINQTGDKVLAAMTISSKQDQSTKVGLHYATPPVSLLQQTYISASRGLRDELALGGLAMTPLDPIEFAAEDVFVGSPLCPRIPKLQAMIATLRANMGEGGSGVEEFIRRHNAFQAWVTMMASICGAIRGIKNPVPREESVDFDSGFAWITDKGQDKGRLPCFPASMLEQLRFNAQYLRDIALCLLRPVSKLPCYFLDKDLNEEVVSPKTIMRELGTWIPVSNSGRHLVYSYLMEYGDPELRDCLVGHYSRGEAPFRLSSFQYQAYADRIRELLSMLLNEIGFEPLVIPVICPTNL